MQAPATDLRHSTGTGGENSAVRSQSPARMRLSVLPRVIMTICSNVTDALWKEQPDDNRPAVGSEVNDSVFLFQMASWGEGNTYTSPHNLEMNQ